MLARSIASGPLRIQLRLRLGPATLVASRILLRGCCFNQRPTMLSDAPQVSRRGGTAYISAVSKKLMPCSMARSSWAWASASAVCSPKVIVPRQISGTVKWLRPSGRVLNAGMIGFLSGRMSGLGAEDAVNQHMALAKRVVAGGNNGQPVFLGGRTMRLNPGISCGASFVETAEQPTKFRGSDRKKMA